MIRHTLLAVAAFHLTACTTSLLDPQFPVEFVPTSAAQHHQPVLPQGVAVLYRKPEEGYTPLGEIRVHASHTQLTPRRIKRLQAEAAFYAADAIIVQPYPQNCATHSSQSTCSAHSKHVIATAIQYLAPPLPTQATPTLEHSFQRGQDTVELYKIDALIEPSAE